MLEPPLPFLASNSRSKEGGSAASQGGTEVPHSKVCSRLVKKHGITDHSSRAWLVTPESKEHRRAISLRTDGATSWTTPVFHDELLEPICMASLCRLNGTSPDGLTRLVFANPHNLDRADGKLTPGVGRDRKNVTIKLSNDGGATWPISRSLEPDQSGDSDLAVGADGTIYCFYERGRSDGNYATKHLTVARFNTEWLRRPADENVPNTTVG